MLTFPPPPPPSILVYFRSNRGTVGAGEIIEAVSSPGEAKIFAGRLSDLIQANFKGNERVRKNVCCF